MEKRMLGSDVEIDEPSGGAEEGTAPSEWLTDERDTPENTIARGAYENTIENLLPEAVKKLDDRSRSLVSSFNLRRLKNSLRCDFVVATLTRRQLRRTYS